MNNYTHIHAETQRRHKKDERTQFFRKKICLSLYLKGFGWVTKGIIVWEWSWRLTRTATCWPPPILLAITAFLSYFPGLLMGGQPLMGHGNHSSIFSSTDSNFLCTELYYCFTPTQFKLSTVKVIPWHPRADAPVIYTGAFLILTAWPVGCQYATRGSFCATTKKIQYLSWSFLFLAVFYPYFYSIA